MLKTMVITISEARSRYVFWLQPPSNGPVIRDSRKGRSQVLYPEIHLHILPKIERLIPSLSGLLRL